MQAKLEGRRPETEEAVEHGFPTDLIYEVFLTAGLVGVYFWFLAADLCFDMPEVWVDDQSLGLHGCSAGLQPKVEAVQSFVAVVSQKTSVGGDNWRFFVVQVAVQVVVAVALKRSVVQDD